MVCISYSFVILFVLIVRVSYVFARAFDPSTFLAVCQYPQNIKVLLKFRWKNVLEPTNPGLPPLAFVYRLF